MIPELHLLGNRNYVQGALLLQFCLEKVKADLNTAKLRDIVVSRYKQFREVETPANLYPKDYHEAPDSMRAALSLKIEEKNYHYKLIALPGNLPRYPDTTYRQSDYHELSKNEVSARVSYVNDFWEVLKEAVYLTKRFHINKYHQQKKYRFVVGGFEKLKYFDVMNNKEIFISCKVMNSLMMKDRLYNQVLITINSELKVYTFQLSFLGREQS
jgi:hypothetical protein